MRQIGSIPNEAAARCFEDYLLAQGITSRIEPSGGGWVVWVHDENKLAPAQAAFDAFVSNPYDPRFAAVASQAAELRKIEAAEERSFRKRYVNLSGQWDKLARRNQPVTLVLIGICVLVAALTLLGSNDNAVLDGLRIASIERDGNLTRWKPGLHEVCHGQVWRLVTPIFLHFGPLHLIFNMIWLHALGGMIEASRRWWKLALLVLVTAVVSNFGEYFWDEWIQAWWFKQPRPPNFGGMSGVVYGLFGYAWMKSRYEPSCGIFLWPNVVVNMIGWLFLCMTGVLSPLVGSIANAAHAVGLVTGVAIGIAPHLWRKIWR